MNIVLIVDLNFFDLSDMEYTLVVYVNYDTGYQDLPDIYAQAPGLQPLG